MSKDYTTSVADAMHRFRTYRAYARTQPQSGWNHEASRNGRLELTAMAGAGV